MFSSKTSQQPTSNLTLKQRLSYKQAKYMVVIAFLMTLVFSAVQITLDYFNTHQEFDKTIQNVLKIVAKPATQAIYNFDNELADEVVEGVFQYRYFASVTLLDEYNDTLASDARPMEDPHSHVSYLPQLLFEKLSTYEIPLRLNNDEYVYGRLVAEVDIYLLAHSFFERSLFQIIADLLLIMLLALTFYFLLHILITAPLSHLSSRLATIDAYNPEKMRLPLPAGHRHDELGQLSNATNALLASIDEKVAEQERINEKLEQRVVERTASLKEANQEISDLNKQLQADNIRMSAELDVTRRLQQMVLPQDEELRQIQGLDIAGFMKPADEVGGDYYDVLYQDGAIKIGIGDVTGHGLESGVLMLMVQTVVRALLNAGVTNPKVFMNALNRTIHANAQRMKCDKNLSLLLLDYENDKLRFTGQHEELLLVRDGGQIERINTFDYGFIVGLVEDISEMVNHREISLEIGDGVVLYTDGITEAGCTQRRCYGVERLCGLIKQNWHHSAAQLSSTIIADLYSHVDAEKIEDDITLVIIKKVA